MGFFSECAIDIANGMPKDKAISINAKLRYGTTKEKQEAKKEETIFWANSIIDRMP